MSRWGRLASRVPTKTKQAKPVANHAPVVFIKINRGKHHYAKCVQAVITVLLVNQLAHIPKQVVQLVHTQMAQRRAKLALVERTVLLVNQIVCILLQVVLLVHMQVDQSLVLLALKANTIIKLANLSVKIVGRVNSTIKSGNRPSLVALIVLLDNIKIKSAKHRVRLVVLVL